MLELGRALLQATAEGDPLAVSPELLLVPAGLVGVVLEALLGKSDAWLLYFAQRKRKLISTSERQDKELLEATFWKLMRLV